MDRKVVDNKLYGTKSKVESLNLVFLGYMNADCTYLTKQAGEQLRLRTDDQYAWHITGDMDTTVSDTSCAYDRFVVLL
ncbi:Deoxyribonuclease gamma [Echinococcus granulosus]|uniref:Deoxyribonuclease gamma n=1 Tax=Echinococcus granulosus TaxID=6210 RepID=W6U6N7_ECHGR|nr:Deoxyribonuclease gamma [Echinococcus granulosus]EUB53982.1 Deoxyribonuclease gamma [Echinococcus granulosus]